jgi:hypothetical protein
MFFSSLSFAHREVDELADIDWDNLRFGIQKTDYMYHMKCCQDGEFCEGDLRPFGNIELSPSAGVLNYGQVCEAMFFYLIRHILFWSLQSFPNISIFPVLKYNISCL